MSEKKPVRYFRFSKKGREIVRRNRAKNGEKEQPHRHLRLSVIVIIACVVMAVILATAVPRAVTNNRLRNLGYDKEAITEIREQNLTKTILDNKYYSDYLAQSIKNKTVNTDYLNLYTVVPAEYGLDDTSFLIYQRLADKGYESDQLVNLFSKLCNYELIPLLVLDYQWDETQYIEECVNHHNDNSLSSFTLDSTFLTPYKVTASAYNPQNTDVLVNSRYGLPESFVPSLTDVSTQYASDGVQLTTEAAAAFEQMSQASVEAGNNFFASSGYVSYDDQNTIYQGCAVNTGDTAENNDCMQAGHNEEQTGLDVTIVPTYESYDSFTSSNVYQWLLQNAASFGFIQRYPVSMASVTGVDDEETVYRYVGKDLAEKVQQSQLTYDEYYCLYLKPWNDQSLVPADSILNATGAVKDVAEEQPEETSSSN